MDKEEAIVKLKEQGFDAFLEKGVVCVVCPEGENASVYMEKFSGTARGMGYEASLGVVPKRELTPGT